MINEKKGLLRFKRFKDMENWDPKQMDDEKYTGALLAAPYRVWPDCWSCKRLKVRINPYKAQWRAISSPLCFVGDKTYFFGLCCFLSLVSSSSGRGVSGIL